MATFAMDVAMSDFFLAGVTDVNDLHFEIQALTGQWVVAVDCYVVAVEVTNGDDLHLAVRRRSVELHADFQLVNAFEHAAAQSADQLSGVFAVSVFRFNGNFQLVTNSFAFQSFFQARDDVACALQVDQRSAAGGAVDDLTSVVGQGIVDGDSLICLLYTSPSPRDS